MPINKITFDGKTLIDLTEDTVNPESLLVGKKAHNSQGQIIDGALEGAVTLPRDIKVVDVQGNTGYIPYSVMNQTGSTLATYWFYQSAGLKEIEFGENCTNIPSDCCFNCDELKTVSIKNNASVNISSSAFNGCDNIDTLKLELQNAIEFSNLKSSLKNLSLAMGRISNNSYNTYPNLETLNLAFFPNAPLLIIGENCFQQLGGNNGITLVLPYECVINTGSFQNTHIKNLTIGNVIEWGTKRTLTNIFGTGIASDLTTLTFVDGIISIPDNMCYTAGQNFDKLTSISLPISLRTIGNNAFQNCTAFTSINIPSNVENIGNSAFRNCTELESIVIPNNVSHIRDHTFHNCSSLNSIEIPNNVETIGEGAFENCTKLESIEIPNNVTTIEDSAFLGCSLLNSIIIGEKVVDIESSIFSDCTSLINVYFKTLPEYEAEVESDLPFYNTPLNSEFEASPIPEVNVYVLYSIEKDTNDREYVIKGKLQSLGIDRTDSDCHYHLFWNPNSEEQSNE